MNIQEKIAKLEAELAELKAEAAKPQKWEPMCGPYFINSHGVVKDGLRSDGCRDFGVEFETEQQAETAYRMFRQYHRLINYVLEKAPDWNFKHTAGERSWSVDVYMLSEDAVERGYVAYSNIGMVYMPKHVAEQLAADINSGVFEL